MKLIDKIKKMVGIGLKKCYIIHKDDGDNYYICKVLNNYDSENKAIKDLCDLLGHKVNEKDLLKAFTDKKDL